VRRKPSGVKNVGYDRHFSVSFPYEPESLVDFEVNLLCRRATM
jgi:hypothetical protein